MSNDATAPGTFVMGQGSIKGAMASAAGGMIGSLAHSAITARTTEGLLPKGQIGYLVAHPDRLALLRVKRGAFKPKATDDVLALVPREEITEVELETKALSGVLTLRFSDGDGWTFEVPRIHLRAARVVVDALTS